MMFLPTLTTVILVAQSISMPKPTSTVPSSMPRQYEYESTTRTRSRDRGTNEVKLESPRPTAEPATDDQESLDALPPPANTKNDLNHHATPVDFAAPSR